MRRRHKSESGADDALQFPSRTTPEINAEGKNWGKRGKESELANLNRRPVEKSVILRNKTRWRSSRRASCSCLSCL